MTSCPVKKAPDIQLHATNFSRDTGFTLNRSWNPTINILQQGRAIRQQQWKDSQKPGISKLCNTDCVMTDGLTLLAVSTDFHKDKDMRLWRHVKLQWAVVSFSTSTLTREEERVSKMDCNSILTQLITRKDFTALSHRANYKSCIIMNVIMSTVYGMFL